MNRKILIYLFAGFVMMSIAVSCVKGTDTDSESYTVSTNVAITSFSLQEDDDVLENLDSVHFSIDLDKGLIFNADSLPKGTDVSALLVDLEYSSAYSVQWEIKNGTKFKNDTTFDYSSEDSVDFTGDVKLTIVAADNVTKKTYDVKVNVHKVVSDSMVWDKLARRDLPSLSGTVSEQRSVKYDNKIYCLMVDKGRYVLATGDSPSTRNWTKSELTFTFNPDVRSLTATGNALYMLDADNGTLYTSTDFSTWTSCGVTWKAISGAYLNNLLGVSEDGGVLKHTAYPAISGFTEYTIEDGFPIAETSDMYTYTSKWHTQAVSLMIGGKDASGNVTGDAWGFDGTTWGKVSNFGVTPHTGMSLVPYFTFETSSSWKVTEYSTWVAFNGKLADGTMDNTVYISRDNGVTWNRGDSLIQLPSYIDKVMCSDALLFTEELEVETRSSNAWTYMPVLAIPVWMRVESPSMMTRTATAVTKWDCPYIYIIGGHCANGEVSNNIWRGVLNRLTFSPIY